MSWTSSFDHELVGMFAGLPVIHPLQQVTADEYTCAFSCHPGQLVIGEGAGYEPTVVVLGPDITAKDYVDARLGALSNARPQTAEQIRSGPDYRSLPSGAYKWLDVFHFAGWSV